VKNLRTAAGLLGLLASPVLAGPEAELAQGLGAGPFAVLQMRFEVTFMKIDVADVDVRLSPAAAQEIERITPAPGFSDDVGDAIEAVLLETDTLLVRMKFRRDADFEKFLNGARNNLNAARRGGVISEDEFGEVYSGLARTMSSLDERGVKKGDVVCYRLDGSTLRIVYMDDAGVALVDESHSGSQWARGIKGSYFSTESRFRDKLIRSLASRGG
jgi:hypothetical protein